MCAGLCVNVPVYICMCMYVCLYVYGCVLIYLCVWAYVFVYACVYGIYICVYMHSCVCACVCMWVHVVLGIKPGASCMLTKYSISWTISLPKRFFWLYFCVYHKKFNSQPCDAASSQPLSYASISPFLFFGSYFVCPELPLLPTSKETARNGISNQSHPLKSFMCICQGFLGVFPESVRETKHRSSKLGNKLHSKE